jgi:hypothetical protein
MTKSPRIPNDDLLAAGLDLMQQNGMTLTKIDSFGRSMMYKLTDSKSVRVRTCNDHILIVLADKPSKDAKLNIEGTDYLLIVMPEVERTPGKVKAYLVPTKVAVEASRKGQQVWLDSNPNTKGDNRTWNLWFRKDANEQPNIWNDYATKWAEYQLKGQAFTRSVNVPVNGLNAVAAANSVTATGTDGSFKAVIETARQMVSNAAGVPLDAVKITIGF